MYDWLDKASDSDGYVVTGSRRLARQLKQGHAECMQQAGRSVWRTPAIHSWSDWLNRMLDRAAPAATLPTRLTATQCGVIWERCLKKEIGHQLLNVPTLVRQCVDTRQKLADWQVPFDAVKRAAVSADQSLYTRIADAYRLELQRSKAIDDAGLCSELIRQIQAGSIKVPPQITLVGFFRVPPAATELLDICRAAGARITWLPESAQGELVVAQFETRAAELRAAGHWARQHLASSRRATLAVVSVDLASDAMQQARLLREGFVPGWQYGGQRLVDTVNVAGRRPLHDYPMVSIALLALRWLQHGLTGREISRLLLSPLIGVAPPLGRAQLELRLRRWPNRLWSVPEFAQATQRYATEPNSLDWLTRLELAAEACALQPTHADPAVWAATFERLLVSLGWPGTAVLDSYEFQLLNRWRELLNEFAALQLVLDKLSFAAAVSRLQTMAQEAVFQAETEAARLQFLDPYEAVDMQFDALWICGLSDSQWPPPGRPLALVSRALQRKYRMPDADPADSIAHASNVLRRLTGGAARVICSYSRSDGDAEQDLSHMLRDFPFSEAGTFEDPGWHATTLVTPGRCRLVANDPVPAVELGEVLSGGAATIDRQRQNPFAAFVYGRLGVSELRPIVSGLSPLHRGNLLHHALSELLFSGLTHGELREWDESDIAARIEPALSRAIRKLRLHPDVVLRAVLNFERQRATELLRRVISEEGARSPFTIDGIEQPCSLAVGPSALQLRCDRVDRLDSDSLLILDYKTGTVKGVLTRDKDLRDLQLAVYALAEPRPVGALGLYFVTNPIVRIDGVGESFKLADQWPAQLSAWTGEVSELAGQLAKGDVRLNAMQSAKDARPLQVLSRIGELRRDS